MTTPARTAHISVRGPFELARAIEMLSGWEPAQRHAQRPDGVLRLAFPLDGAFTPSPSRYAPTATASRSR